MRESLFDTIDSLAATKLETALEVLMGAESSKLSTARLMSAMQHILGVQPDDQILPPFNLTTTIFVKHLVSARSQLLHGTWSTLNARLPVRRDGFEAVVGAVLRQAVIKMHAYAQEPGAQDNMDAFILWLSQRSAASKSY
jgi:hypothetical protein